MSSLWTPDGERPVRRSTGTGPGSGPGTRSGGGSGNGFSEGFGDGFGDGFEDGTDDDLQGYTAAELAAATAELLAAPASAVVANHCVGLFQLAALHLSQEAPRFGEAALAIDALGAIVEGLGARLGDDEATLVDALAQIRLAFVQVQAAGGSRG